MVAFNSLAWRLKVNKTHIDIPSALIIVFAGLTEIIKQCMYVGMADDVLALAQCKTRLYVLNVVNLR